MPSRAPPATLQDVEELSQGAGQKYRHVRTIADGGMGTVSLAVREEGRFRRAYAIKRLRQAYREDSHVRSMFLEEARIAGLLHHTNIVSVVDVGEDESGPYLLMDYVQGVSLSDLVTEARSRGEFIPVQVCVRVVKQVADGLHAAHELVGRDGTKLELVHRDVSPQNILVGYDGVARLTDFGIAKALGRTDRTQTGVLKGKFGYFSPEQLQFEEPTRRSDIFSLGIVLYETLSASRLYGGNDGAKSARRILNDPPPDIDEVRSDLHPALVHLLLQMLVKDPDYRPKTADEVAHRLDAVLVDLVAEQGSLSVSQYVLERFDERKQQQRREVDELTAAPKLHPVSVRPRRKKRRAVLLAIMGAALIALLGLWLIPERTTSVEPLAEIEPTPVIAPTTTIAAEAPALPEPAPAEVEEEQSTAAPPKRTARRPKPTRRVRRAPKPEPTKAPSRTAANEDMWEFDAYANE